ncbi:MAG: RhuM family protein [Flavobacteriales bacterium]
MENQIEIFKSNEGLTEIEVRIEGDTVWLNQSQLTDLFESSKSNISEHIKRIFESNELSSSSTVRKFRTVRKEGERQVSRELDYFNLDVIISVGYRVNSYRGIEFRQWATKRLKEFLIEGVAINEKRLAEKNKEIQILHDGIRILSRVIEDRSFHQENLSWMQHFHLGLKLLDDYDHESLDIKGNHTEAAKYPNHSEYLELIETMRTGFNSDLFGKEKDGSFNSSIHQIRQSFHGQEVYPTIEEKAAMLLYLIVKNHAFVDGNKRIAAACFLLFLQRNNLLYLPSGRSIISNEALASLTLFVAASQADEMGTVKKLVMSVLNRSSD